MIYPGSGLGQRLRLFCLIATFALATPSVRADEYAPVNQLLQDGQLTQAMTKADQYLAKNPRDPQMRFLKGLIQQDSGQRDAAITTYETLIQDYPELPEPYNNVAVLYAKQGQFEKARAALDMAIRNSPSYAIAYENMGDVYVRLAAEAYRQAQQKDAGNTTVAPKLALTRQIVTSSAAKSDAPAAKSNTPIAPTAKR